MTVCHNHLKWYQIWTLLSSFPSVPALRSFVMLDVFLDKLEVDNAELLYVQHPSMVEVFEAIQEDSVDQDELDDVPRTETKKQDGVCHRTTCKWIFVLMCSHAKNTMYIPHTGSNILTVSTNIEASYVWCVLICKHECASYWLAKAWLVLPLWSTRRYARILKRRIDDGGDSEDGVPTPRVLEF